MRRLSCQQRSGCVGTFVPTAPQHRRPLLGVLWQQAVEPAAVQVVDPEVLGGWPVPSCLGSSSSSGHVPDGGPPGASPHAQAAGPESRGGGGQGGEGRRRRQAGWVGVGHSDAGALQQQDAAGHQVGDAQAQQQHPGPSQQAVESAEGHRHPALDLSGAAAGGTRLKTRLKTRLRTPAEVHCGSI